MQVVLYVEVAQFEVAGHLAAAVPGTGIVIGVHRHASQGEAQVTVGRIDAPHEFILFLACQQVEGIPVQLVERGAPSPELCSLLPSVEGQQCLSLSLPAE